MLSVFNRATPASRSPVPVRAIALIGLAATLGGCATDDLYEGAFSVPSAAAVFDEATPTPFSEPIAYIGNLIGGDIHPLAARQGRFLTERQTASFLRGDPLPTGEERVIVGVAPWAPTDQEIVVFAADQAFGQLLEIPHITSVSDGEPVPSQIQVSDPSSTGGATVHDLQATTGRTSTEDWTLTWRDEAWWVEGSRSGRLAQRAVPGELYEAPEVGLSFRVDAGTVDREVISFRTDSGLIEHDLGGAPIALQTTPDQSLLAVALAEPDGVGQVVWFDPFKAAEHGRVELPPTSRPTRFHAIEGDLWIADAGEPAIWRVAFGQIVPQRYDLPWPVSDVAVSPTNDRAFVTPLQGRSIWALDLQSGELIDLNPWSPQVEGRDFTSVVRGIGALPTASTYPFDDEDGFRPRGHLLAVSLSSGAVAFMDQRTGCMVPDQLGPRTLASGFGTITDHSTNFSSVPGRPTFVPNATNDRSVVVNNCAGIAQAERWELEFNAAQQAWSVTGDITGEQSRHAYEGERYTSDGGEISFVLRTGTTPSIDGWTIEFTVADGMLRVNSDVDEGIEEFDFFRQQLSEIRFEMPGDPVPLSFVQTTDTPGWQDSTPTSYALVPIEGTNAVTRILPEDGSSGAIWR